MTRWAAFAGVTAFVLLALLALARASQSVVRPRQPGWPDAYLADGAGHLDVLELPPPRSPRLSAGILLVNVALSQGVLGVLLLLGVWYFQVPVAALGRAVSVDLGLLGVSVGVGLFVAGRTATAVARTLGVAPGTAVRDQLTPTTRGGWVVLLVGVLPLVAGFEELLFRGVLIGALSLGFGISPWLLALGSAVVFAVGHGAQGSAGVALSGALGLVLGIAFVLTGSLVVVVVAHYVVNALEFLVHRHLDPSPMHPGERPA